MQNIKRNEINEKLADEEIIGLFWQRSENAVSAVSDKYGRYCYAIAYNILQQPEDAEECLNDTYARAWNSIPPQKPRYLAAFLGKITRNLALQRVRGEKAQKRGGGKVDIALSELDACLSGGNLTEDCFDEKLLIDALNRFLKGLPQKQRVLFLQRYWYFCSVKELAKLHNMTESNVKTTLYRCREQLREFLKDEGVRI